METLPLSTFAYVKTILLLYLLCHLNVAMLGRDAGQEIDDDIERRRPGQPGSGRDSAVAEAHQTLILRGFALHNAKAFGQMNLGAVASQLSVSIQ